MRKENNGKEHKLVRGLSRLCIRCSYKYGCCKKCDLCKLCHAKEYGDMRPGDVLKEEDGRESYYRALEGTRKQKAIIDPGNLGSSDYFENYQSSIK